MGLIQEQTTAWLASGETGSSSKTMAFWLAFGQCYRHCAHPHDPSDFRRCLLLLNAAPLLRPLLPKMGELSPQWAALVSRWDEIETQLLLEMNSGEEAPRTYRLMKEVLSDG